MSTALILLGLSVAALRNATTRTLANHLSDLCYRASYDTYNANAYRQRIKEDLCTAAQNRPSSTWASFFSDLLRRLTGGRVNVYSVDELLACAIRYPTFSPVVYTIADILYPGWNTPTQDRYSAVWVSWTSYTF
ncbi:uncharacterized protein EI97DRAFT_442455 [Westerdykella ornata]|uniref:Uncharacterized protein n=1 Tax=Westerdykella ornata TaxID=318751 RepID=A0A6A6JLJ7_WESOR|nr:uncharacterized protein EI97DRAFT_442455 [Westerdykella ornata]KAF2276526.1 hypothetical protein EI97DRAFT_442455 [Westerdykella ornata]